MTFRGILAGTARTQAFGNGRFARNLLEEAIGRHAWRLQDVEDPTHAQLRELKPEDFRQLADPEPVVTPLILTRFGNRRAVRRRRKVTRGRRRQR